MLILPYSVGVAVGGGLTGRSLLGLFGILLLFLSRQPLLRSLKNKFRGKKAHRPPDKEFLPGIILLTAGGAVYLWLSVRYRLWGLLTLGLVAMVLLSLHTYLVLNRKERTLIAEILGVGLLMLSAPAGFVVSGGRVLKEILILWVLHALYFSGSVFYVKMRKKALPSKKELRFPKNIDLVRECLAYVLILILALSIFAFIRFVHVLIILAFVPMIIHTLRGIFKLRTQFEIMKQGIILTALSLMFAALMVVFWK